MAGLGTTVHLNGAQAAETAETKALSTPGAMASGAVITLPVTLTSDTSSLQCTTRVLQVRVYSVGPKAPRTTLPTTLCTRELDTESAHLRNRLLLAKARVCCWDGGRNRRLLLFHVCGLETAPWTRKPETEAEAVNPKKRATMNLSTPWPYSKQKKKSHLPASKTPSAALRCLRSECFLGVSE